MRKPWSFIGTLLVFLIAGGAIYCSGKTLWPLTKSHFYELGKHQGYIPTGQRVRPFILGFDNFTADLYWLRAVQYAGGHSGAFEFNALPDYLDLITDLDPHFLYVYYHGGLVFPLNEKTIKRVRPLLEKGIQNNINHPDVYKLYTQLAYITYYYFNDYQSAASLYEFCGEKVKNCPRYVHGVAASLRSQSGEHGISLRIWLEKHFADIESKNDEEWTVEVSNIEEAAKLVALTCAAKNYNKEITKLSELKGVSIYPCSDFSQLSPPQKNYIGAKATEYGLITITNKTLTSPFDHNPFVWDAEEKKVTGKIWLLKKQEKSME